MANGATPGSDSGSIRSSCYPLTADYSLATVRSLISGSGVSTFSERRTFQPSARRKPGPILEEPWMPAQHAAPAVGRTGGGLELLSLSR